MGWAENAGNGDWYACYRAGGKKEKLRDGDGRPLRFRSKKEAERKATAKEDDKRKRNATVPGAGKITWGEWCDDWWPEHKKTIEGNTVSGYKSKLETHVKPRWKDVELDDIEHDDVQDWIDGLDVAPATVAVILWVFSASLTAADKTGRIDENPCVDIILPTIEPPDPHFLTRLEFDALIPFLEHEWRMLALICVGTGMRWGEAVALHWQDVHFDAKTVVIRYAYSKHGKYVKAYPKNANQRVVPLPPWLAGELRDWRDDQLPADRCGEEHRAAKRRRGRRGGAEGQDPLTGCRSGLVVPDVDGTTVAYTTCNHRLRTAVRLAKVGHTCWHDLRDTYASWLLQSGRVTIEQIAELLGHADINLTRKRYARFATSQFDAVAAALGAPSLPGHDPEDPGAGEAALEVAAAAPEDLPDCAPRLPSLDDPNIIDLAARRRSRTTHEGDHEESV